MTEEETESPEEKRSASLKWLFVLIAVVLIVQFGTWWLITYFEMAATPELGQFGDMFGAVNTLFSGLAFAGIIYTILLQRNELSLQRKELKDTREELKLSRQAHVETSKIMAQQLQLLKSTTKIEQAEHRKSVLPHFVLPEIIEQEREGDRAVWVWNYTNIGKDIKDIMILIPDGQEEVGFVSPPTSYLKGNGNRGAWSIWSVGKLNGTYKFTMFFKSMDDQLWKFDFHIIFSNGEFNEIYFMPANEHEREKFQDAE